MFWVSAVDAFQTLKADGLLDRVTPSLCGTLWALTANRNLLGLIEHAQTVKAGPWTFTTTTGWCASGGARSLP